MKLTHHIKNIFKKPQIWDGNFCLSKTGALSRIHGKELSCILAICLLPLYISCTDDNLLSDPNRGNSSNPEINLEDYRLVPLAINYGNSVYTRADDSVFQDGTALDHRMDFETPHESFAIFFNEDETTGKNMFMYVKPLQTYESLGYGHDPDDGIGEWVRYALSYVHKDSIPAKVLVVLNGGRIYDELFSEEGLKNYMRDLANQPFELDSNGKPKLDDKGNKIYKTEVQEIDDCPEKYDLNWFLDFEWKSEYSKKDGVIGQNDDGLFTMTNAAYYGPDDESKITTAQQSEYRLQTARKLDQDLIRNTVANATNMRPDKAAATIYVERMVAKFSPPTFSTQVIGSDRFFRPSQNAMTMIIYGWDSNNKEISEQRNWRIHVLGWTINGRETSNYLYKHIKQAWGEKENGTFDTGNGALTNWVRTEWNKPQYRRSYWSVDPHYDKDIDYYPLQYRTPVNNQDISLEIKYNPSSEKLYKYDSALRYFSFNDVIGYWSDNPLTISENTYDPIKYPAFSDDSYDGRAQVLVGPHLLVGAEVYVEDANAANSNNNYIGQFTPVDNLYGDRLGRYYRDEIDWFKMFVRDLNNALHSQDHMSFTYYDWKSDIDQAASTTSYTAYPTGACRLRYDPEADLPAGQTLGTNDPRRKYMDQEFNADLLDKMLNDMDMVPYLNFSVDRHNIINTDSLKKYVVLSIPANIQNGDGRRIPWLDGIVMRDPEGNRLAVYDSSNTNKTGDPLTWNDNMRISLFFEWFGAVDHYYKGYMYYSNPIPHHKVSGSNLTYYGAVRNHWYTFTVNAINALGIPVDDPDQPIVPGNYNYEGMIQCDLDIIDWHSMQSEITFDQ